ncbi:CD109 antigen-like [Simochromis diagramma]|uniref:CD109 antigen-like n=1 Tax=Simochromis diagramma TaxID=43689 RepID=UPI001A7E2FFC|nr:CD109 antigen-like [Simochromis diagramma]
MGACLGYSNQAKCNTDNSDWELLAAKLELKEQKRWLEGAEDPLIIWSGSQNVKPDDQFCQFFLERRRQSFLQPPPQPSYLLLAPKALQHGIPTSISVTILIPSPVTVSAHIVRGNLTMASQSVKVEGGSTTLLTLPPISDSEPNHREAYILEVKGHRGEVQVFSSSTKLHLDLEDIATFIQTDKVMYLPGQTVKIRVVSIHSDGKPFISPVDIIIRDPRGNLLRQWLAADSVLGVVSKEFQLSENPPLGQWTIIATVKDISSVKYFTVAQYVLAKV